MKIDLSQLVTREEKERSRLMELQAEFAAAAQARLDAFARSRGYDSILSATTYATSTVTRFKADGQTAIAARDGTWNRLYTLLEEIETGARPVPVSFEEIERELPPLVWPAAK